VTACVSHVLGSTCSPGFQRLRLRCLAGSERSVEAFFILWSKSTTASLAKPPTIAVGDSSNVPNMGVKAWTDINGTWPSEGEEDGDGG